MYFLKSPVKSHHFQAGIKKSKKKKNLLDHQCANK